MKKSGAVFVEILLCTVLALTISLGASYLMSSILVNFTHIQERNKNSLGLLSVIEALNVAAFDLQPDICSLYSVTVDDNLSVYQLNSFRVSVLNKADPVQRCLTWRVWDIKGR